MATGTIDSIFNIAVIQGKIEKMLKQTADNIDKYYKDLSAALQNEFKKISNFKELQAGQEKFIDIRQKATGAIKSQADLQESLLWHAWWLFLFFTIFALSNKIRLCQTGNINFPQEYKVLKNLLQAILSMSIKQNIL